MQEFLIPVTEATQPRISIKRQITLPYLISDESETTENIDFSISEKGEIRFKGKVSTDSNIVGDILTAADYRKQKAAKLESILMDNTKFTNMGSMIFLTFGFMVVAFLLFRATAMPNRAESISISDLEPKIGETVNVRRNMGRRCFTN